MDKQTTLTAAPPRFEAVALELVLFTGARALAPQHIMQLGVHLSALFDAPPAIMPLPLDPPQVVGLFQKLDGSESLHFEPGKISYKWDRQRPERPAVVLSLALDALVQIATSFEGFGISFSDVALIITQAARLSSPPRLLDVAAHAALFADAAEVELRWLQPIPLTTWQRGNHWQRVTSTSTRYPDGVDAPTLLHEQEINTLTQDDPSRSLGATLVGQFVREALSLMDAAEARVYQHLIPAASS